MKKPLNSKTITGWMLLALTLVIVACKIALVLSPYKVYDGSKQKMVKHSIIINQPPDKVFKFMGDARNTKHWLVYADHVKVLNAADSNAGEAGTLKRFYCNYDEQGQQWDGLVTKVVKNKKRELKIFNLVGFPFIINELITQQLYKALPGNKCELSFTVFYKSPVPAWQEEIKAGFAAYRVKSIFSESMRNIKITLETKKEFTKF